MSYMLMMIEDILLKRAMLKVDKSAYNNDWYNPGSKTKRILWMLINPIFIKNHFFPFAIFKVFILKAFGAKIGKRLTIKQGVNIKYPWFLEIGDYVGLGENVWIDNLAHVKIGNQATISQGVYLLTGNHDFNSQQFELIIKPITIEDGVWIGAKSTVCPGVTCHSHSVLGVGSTLTKNMDAYGIYFGLPATKVKERKLR